MHFILNLIVVIFVVCFIRAPLILHAANPLPGSGFDSREQAQKDSPLKEIEYAWGNMLGGLDLHLVMH